METKRSGSAFRNYLDIAATVAVIIAAAALVVALAAGRSTTDGPIPRKPKTLAVPTEPLSLAGARTEGNANAPLVVLEFADYQCPACAMFANTILPKFVDDYVATGRVLYAFQHLPLESIHPLAKGAAQAADCAARQGRFSAMSRELFAISPRLETPRIDELATRLALNRSDYDACLAEGVGATIKNAEKIAKDLGVFSIPAFFLGTLEPDGRVKVKATHAGVPRTADAFVQLIDSQLNSNTKLK